MIRRCELEGINRTLESMIPEGFAFQRVDPEDPGSVPDIVIAEKDVSRGTPCYKSFEYRYYLIETRQRGPRYCIKDEDDFYIHYLNKYNHVSHP